MMRFGVAWLALVLFVNDATAQDRMGAVLDVVQKNFREDLSRDALEERALRAVLKDLDPYSNYMNAAEWADLRTGLSGHFGGIGVILESDPGTKLPQVQYLMIHSPAAAAGVRRGDLLVKIDGHPMEGLAFDGVFPILRGVPGSIVELTLRHAGSSGTSTLRIRRGLIETPSVRGVRRTESGEPEYLLNQEKGIGYVRVMRLADDTVPLLENALRTLTQQRMRGLILDLRDSAGGRLKAAVGAADLFLDRGRVLTVASRIEGVEEYDADECISTNVPVVMLINEWTASSSEILAGALTDNHRVLTMGQRTYGKGRVQVMFSLAEGMGGVVLTTGTFQRPSGKTFDQHDPGVAKGEAGIAPDPGLEFVLEEKESRTWADKARRLDGATVLTAEEQVFAVPDRMLDCALEVLQGAIEQDAKWAAGVTR